MNDSSDTNALSPGASGSTEGTPFTPARELRIADVETLRVLADPLRLRILEVFDAHPDDALTVKVVAAALAEPVTKLYYHVNLLERHGLLAVVAKRLVSGIVEKRYRLAAESLHVDRALFGSSGADVTAEASTLIDAVFGSSRRNLERALGSGPARLGTDDPTPARGLLARFTQRLSPDAAVQARRLIEELIERVGALAAATPAPSEPATPASPAAPADAATADAATAAAPAEAGSSARDADAYEFLVVFNPVSDELVGTPAAPVDEAPRAGGDR